MLYLLIITCLFGLSFYYDYLGRCNGKRNWYIFILIIFILVAGLRYRLGGDTIRYEEYFNDNPSLFELPDFDFSQTRFAPGFIIFTAFAKSIYNDFVSLQLLEAAYVNISIFLFFWRYCSKIFFAIILYAIFEYFNYNFEVLREACAIATFLLAFPYLIKKSWIKYYIMALISLSFHTSAAIILIIPFCTYSPIKQFFQLNNKTVYIIILCIVISKLLSEIMFDYIREYITIDNVQTMALMYEYSDLGSSSINYLGIISSFIKYALYPLAALIILKKLNQIKTENRDRFISLLKIMLILSIIIVVFSIYIQILIRFINYFVPFLILIIANATFTKIKIKRHFIKLSFFVWIAIYLPLLSLQLYDYFSFVNGNKNLKTWMKYYPYESIFTQEISPEREAVFYIGT